VNGSWFHDRGGIPPKDCDFPIIRVLLFLSHSFVFYQILSSNSCGDVVVSGVSRSRCNERGSSGSTRISEGCRRVSISTCSVTCNVLDWFRSLKGRQNSPERLARLYHSSVSLCDWDRT